MTDDDTLAAEYALGLLEGEDLLAARTREANDAGFADAVARWQERLAPLADDVPARTPRAELWQRIEAGLGGDTGSAEIVSLRRRLRRWQWAGGLSAAAAVVLAFLALPQLRDTNDTPTVITQAPGLTEPPLAANMPIEGTPLRLDFTYLPGESSLVVTAIGLTADGVHDHEIWLVPPEGDLVSLGLVKPGEVRAHSVPVDVGRLIADGSRLVLTREPIGGKPAGQDAGPIVAEAKFAAL